MTAADMTAADMAAADMANAGESEFIQARQSRADPIELYVQPGSAQIDRDRLDRRVLTARAEVRRHDFIPREFQHLACDDSPIPIGRDESTSQPFLVARITGLPDRQQHPIVDKNADGRSKTRDGLQVVFSPLIDSP